MRAPMLSIDAWRFAFIRARSFANLGPALRDACIAIFALALVACGPGTAARGVSRGSIGATGGSSGGEIDDGRVGDYTLAAEGVHVREGELDGISFLEVVLGDGDPGAELPLLVVIHGLGDYPDIPVGPYRGLSRAVRIVLPRGPLVSGDGFAWMSVRVRDGELETLSSELSAQTERLALFLASLRRERRVRGATVVIGFSQGAMLTLALGTHHPELVGLALPLAGWLPPALRVDATSGSPRFVWMHGTADERIPFALAEEAVTELRARGFDVSLVPFEGAVHAMSDAMDTAFHAWLERVLSNLDEERAPGDGLPLP
jgi:phospholipase/carboxylesterase